jgi:hypothetical protein
MNNQIGNTIQLLPPPRLMSELEPPGYFEETYADSRPLNRPEPLPEMETYSFSKLDRNQFKQLPDSIHNAIKEKLNCQFSLLAFYPNNLTHEHKEINSLAYVLDIKKDITYKVVISNNLEKLIDIYETKIHISPNSEEIKKAIVIAQENENVSKYISNEMIGRAIMIEETNPESEYFGKRLFDVQFGNPNQRLPKFKAIVDIYEGNVISYRPISQPVVQRKEVCHE